MKKYLLFPFLLLFLNICCGSDDTASGPFPLPPLQFETLVDVAYGNDEQQTMDIYLPQNRNLNTKVIVLVHGGFWEAGSKEDMNFIIPTILQQLPDHAIVNINYRLATPESPAYPKQINDIKKALNHLKTNNYYISDSYAMLGVSAGAHLSMLYSYKYDLQHNVKAVIDLVGPADFTDPEFRELPEYEDASMLLLGTATPGNGQINQINPVAHINALSPPTLSFYGGQDYLIPSSQGLLLKGTLDGHGVYNEFNFYPEGGHLGWDEATMLDVLEKTVLFLQNHFD